MVKKPVKRKRVSTPQKVELFELQSIPLDDGTKQKAWLQMNSSPEIMALLVSHINVAVMEAARCTIATLGDKQGELRAYRTLLHEVKLYQKKLREEELLARRNKLEQDTVDTRASTIL